ncbi:chemotaxis protein CheA [Desulfonema magnum]|uniref:histidine kinase n=1 Tax=Desulfonema magnum TaxID=45655 RepID=A0A975BWU5_9BACT|nr:chemotaxis protein CheA [Desulfonema magnum]QTA92620.1 Two component system histidine kinase, CheW domain-containing [Desulfonema magnum]
MDLSLLQDFIAEAEELLEEMETNLLQLEEEPGNQEVLNDIFRSAHTIKGIAEYLGMEKIAGLSHKLENLLEILRHGGMSPDREIIDILIDSRDRIAMLSDDLERTQTEKTEIGDLIERIDQLSAKASDEEVKNQEYGQLVEKNGETEFSAATGVADEAVTPPKTPVDEQVCHDIDMEKASQYYDDLKVILYEMGRGDINDEKKTRVIDIIRQFIQISECTGRDDLTKNLENLRNQAMVLSFPDDANDMLADLHRFMRFLLPESYIEEPTSEAVSQENRIEPEETDAVSPDFWDGEAQTEIGDDETYEEEYDDELFDIFLQHMKDNLSLLNVQIGELGRSENKTEILDQSLIYINSLRSSANYMDYKKLVRIYDQWTEDIKVIQEKLSLGEEISFGYFTGPDIESGMMVYIDQIVRRFPKYDIGADLKPVSPETETVQEDKGLSDGDQKDEVLSSDLPALENTELSPPETSETEMSSPEAPGDTEEEILFPPGILDEIEKDDLSSADVSKAEDAADEGEESLFPPGILDEIEKDDLSSADVSKTKDSGQAETDDLTAAEALADEGEEHLFPTEIPDEIEKDDLSYADVPKMEAEEEPDDAPDYQGLFDELDDVFDSVAELAESPESDPELYQGDLEAKLSDSTAEIEIPKAETEVRVVPEAPREKISGSDPLLISEIIEKETGLAETVQTDGEARVRKTDFTAPPTEKVLKHSLRVDAGKIDSLMNQVGELVVSRAWFSQLYREMKELQRHLHENIGLDQREMKPVRSLTFKLSEATVALGRVANELQEGVMKVRMLPIAQLFNRYPRLVRDLVHNTNQKKKVRLEIVGEETELDKMVIEEISDPLIHIIRNAVDHGCETTEKRRKSGKPEECILKLESYHESNHVVIEISDDGRGIDLELIKQKALEKNFFSQDELDRMAPRELMSVIMKPGFSTTTQVSKTSGRGVGMDVVKKNVEKLNGTIEIDSKAGVGTRFRIKIPLTLAIIQALLVRVGSDIFTIPLAAVEETLRIFEHDISMIEGVEVIHLRDSTLSLLRLSEIFNIDPETQDAHKAFVVVVNTGMRRMGLVVDALIGQEETVIKPLVDYLQENSGFSGATILGDGRISLILDVYELINISISRQEKKKGDISALGGTDRHSVLLDAHEHGTIH